MEYKLSEILDLENFKSLMDNFYKITKVPYGLFDSNGDVILGIGWQEICVNFHRKNKISSKICRKSDMEGFVKSKSNKYYIHKCKHGIIDSFISVIVKGETIAYLALGQFFFEEPDLEYFINQAKQYNYDIDSYLQAVKKVPIIAEKDFHNYMNYFLSVVNMIKSYGEKFIDQKNTEKLLIENKAQLQNEVKQQTASLREINKNLRQSRENYFNLLEFMPYGVIVRKGYKILFANDGASKIFKAKPREDLRNRKINDILEPHPEFRDRFEYYIKLAEKQDDLPPRNFKFIRKNDGEGVNILVVSKIVPYNGRQAVLVLFRDISHREKIKALNKEVIEKNKQLKKALKYDLLKTEFFSNLSHEIRTPINVIYSALQTTSSFVDGIETDSTFEKDKVEKYVGIMKQNCFRLIRLINNILDITKLDSGYLKLELQNCNIVEIIENITLSVVDYIESTGIKVIFDTEIEEKNIACDPEKIERVILNLLSNAVKFTEKGGKIYVNIIDIGENIMISVRDTGKGIPVERQKHIFQRFVQVDKSLSRLQEGSGIGLSLVKSIVEIHGGEITMNSQIGVGTEFIINLPVKLVDDNEPLKNEPYQNNTNVEKVSIEFSDIYF